MSDVLDQAADLAGILPAYRDLDGVEHVASPDTKRALLKAMGFSIDPLVLSERVAEMHAQRADRRLPDTCAVEADVPSELGLTPGSAVSFRLSSDDRVIAEGTSEEKIALPALKPGYYTLTVHDEETLIIAAPPRAPSVQDITGRGRVWGVTGGLYALRSQRNAGVGDYQDLADLAVMLAEHDADFIGINPVHSIGAAADLISPYSPSHREFYSPRHIAWDKVPEAERLPASAMRALQDAPLVDYFGVDGLTVPLARAAYRRLVSDKGADRYVAFEQFCAARGKDLTDFAIFEALSIRHGPDWRTWPEALKSPASTDVAAFAAEHADDIGFFKFLQWIANDQLAHAQKTAVEAGMKIGLYHDLAVGVRPAGAEPWAKPDVFAPGVSLGGPPDQFNAAGQTWGLTPFNPIGLRRHHYDPFIRTMRTVMRHAGMIRIDHAIGLMQCYWVPETGEPGGYVRYPLDILLAIIRVEAWRSGCIVIGEDLGVVPEGLRAKLAESGLYGCAIMQFDRNDDQSFQHPAEYPAHSIASFGTHDTPTLAGFWQGSDITARKDIRQISGEEAAERHWLRGEDRARLANLAGIEEGQGPMTPEQNQAVHALLATRASELAAVQLDDILNVTAQPNMPGTTTEYPNWRIKYGVSLENLTRNAGLKAISALFTPK